MSHPTVRCSTSDPDRILAATDLVVAGAFRCEVGHPRFRDSGPIRQSCFVFPRTTVGIAHEGGPRFVADPTVVTLYDTGQRYVRDAVSQDGDRCDWFAVADSTLRDAARAFDPAAADAPVSPWRRAYARTSPELYRRQRALHLVLCSGAPEPLALEERVIALLHDVLAGAYATPPVALDRTAAARRRRGALIDGARTLVGRRFKERLSLSTLSKALGCSPFHLCRAFHEGTRTTLHSHLVDIRLRASLELLEEGCPLTDVAHEVGFSNHSHYAESFRRHFGGAPSRAAGRRRIRRPGLWSSTGT